MKAKKAMNKSRRKVQKIESGNDTIAIINVAITCVINGLFAHQMKMRSRIMTIDHLSRFPEIEALTQQNARIAFD